LYGLDLHLSVCQRINRFYIEKAETTIIAIIQRNRVVLSLGDFSVIFHIGKFDNSWILVKFVNFGIEEENNLI